MRSNFTFELEDKRWYVVLPEWEGDRGELEMVAGADVMLDILADGNSTVTLELSVEPKPCCLTLFFDREDGGGGWYSLATNSDNVKFENIHEIWLCHVTKFVFGELPSRIFVNKLN
jgi:hypothetical protein